MLWARLLVCLFLWGFLLLVSVSVFASALVFDSTNACDGGSRVKVRMPMTAASSTHRVACTFFDTKRSCASMCALMHCKTRAEPAAAMQALRNSRGIAPAEFKLPLSSASFGLVMLPTLNWTIGLFSFFCCVDSDNGSEARYGLADTIDKPKHSHPSPKFFFFASFFPFMTGPRSTSRKNN